MAKQNKLGLRNPAVLAVASSPAGQSAINAQAEVVKQTASVIPFVLKLTVLAVGGYVLYSVWADRFISMKEISSYPDANITDDVAKSRADAIHASMGLFVNDFENVKINWAGLNYNGAVKVYNAFGRRGGHYLTRDLNLFEWFKDQFSVAEVAELRFLVPGFF